MKREIKFRAWNDNIKKMTDDFLLIPSRGFALQWSDDGHTGATLDHFALMQYTGLKDKNGKEIYEGDILMFPDTESEYVDVGIGEVKVAETETNAFFPVEYQEGQFGMSVHGTEHGILGWISLRDFLHDYFPMAECEVIGDIYQNPELLSDTN